MPALLVKLISNPKVILGLVIAIALMAMTVVCFKAGVHHNQLSVAKKELKASEATDKANKQVIEIEGKSITNLTDISNEKEKALEEVPSVTNSSDARSLLNKLYSKD